MVNPNKKQNKAAAGVPTISVVAPCYNEQDNLDSLLERVSRSCRDVAGDSYEIILVDDGSIDATWEKIASAGEKDNRVRGVKLSRNFGHQIALTAGLVEASGDWILIIDADLQDPPELLSTMMSHAENGADVVYGQRRSRAGDSLPRRLASAAFYRLLRALSDVPVPVDTGDFRLVSRRVLNAVNSMPEQHRYVRGLVSWVGFNQTAISYDRDARAAGETGYNFRRLLTFSLDAIVGFSERPLRLATIVGFSITALSLGVIAALLALWISSDIEVDGWISIMASIFLLGGLNIMFMGLIGEYIGRIFVQSKGRPLYIVEERTGASAKSEPSDPSPAE